MLFERLRLNWKIRRLQRLRDRNFRVTIAAILEVAYETGEIPDQEAVKDEILNTVESDRLIDEQISILETNYWLEQAQRSCSLRPMTKLTSVQSWTDVSTISIRKH